MPDRGDAANVSGEARLLSPPERRPLLPPSNDEDDLPYGSLDRDDEESEAKSAPRWQHQDTFRLLSVMFNFFFIGVCQTALGALIPDIERYYHQSDGPTAVIFVAQMAGYLCATALIQPIHLRFGRRGIALLSPLLRLVAASLLSTGAPFHLVLPVYSILGFGTALGDAGWCAWASGLPYANICQGMMHGSFSAGCIVGPMAVLAVLNKGFDWYGFYVFAVPVLFLEVIVETSAFRHDNAASYRMNQSTVDEGLPLNPLQTSAPWMCGLFFFVYVGIESSFSDWIIIFMRRIRHLAPESSSIAASSFWFGMAIGRLLLGFVTESFGLRGSVTAYILLSTIAQILFRQITASTQLSFLLLGLNGFFCGPLFPSGILLLATKLPKQSHVGAVAAAAAMGQVGGAVAPLGIGLLADKFGIGHLLDVVLMLSAVMLVIWVVFSRRI